MADYYKRKGPRSADWNYGGYKWKLSRSKIDLFTECERCFYLDNKLGVTRPKMPSFTLNIAVDALLKKEFDEYRTAKIRPPLLEKYGIDALPFVHPDLELWRDNFEGVQFKDPGLNMTISGAVDDIWVNPAGELLVVDYKATSKDGTVDSLDDTKWQQQYRRQMEVYQWLLRKKGFVVSDTGYFVYVNGRKDLARFDGKLEFDVTLIANTGNDAWIPDVLGHIKRCLESDVLPEGSAECDYCIYRQAVRAVEPKVPAQIALPL